MDENDLVKSLKEEGIMAENWDDLVKYFKNRGKMVHPKGYDLNKEIKRVLKEIEDKNG